MTGAGRAWDSYWRDTRERAAFREGGAQEAVLERFWSEVFAIVMRRCRAPRLLDVASGNGIVTAHALRAAQAAGVTFSRVCGSDSSGAALDEYRRRFPLAETCLADTLALPLPDGSFDLVASQFGVEYAGADAVLAIARLVAPGGMMAIAAHYREGGLYREGAANLRAVESLLASGVTSAALALFTAGAAARAQRDLDSALARLARLANEHGAQAMGGSLARFHGDLRHMAARAAAYDHAEARAWIAAMADEFGAYRERMRLLLAVALDEGTIERLVAGLGSRGFAIERREPLIMGSAQPLPGAWALVAQRPAPG
jgi:SAM-dependent methyltransferase